MTAKRYDFRLRRGILAEAMARAGASVTAIDLAQAWRWPELKSEIPVEYIEVSAEELADLLALISIL